MHKYIQLYGNLYSQRMNFPLDISIVHVFNISYNRNNQSLQDHKYHHHRSSKLSVACMYYIHTYIYVLSFNFKKKRIHILHVKMRVKVCYRSTYIVEIFGTFLNQCTKLTQCINLALRWHTHNLSMKQTLFTDWSKNGKAYNTSMHTYCMSYTWNRMPNLVHNWEKSDWHINANLQNNLWSGNCNTDVHKVSVYNLGSFNNYNK